jgi:hypothetical protein
MRKGPLNWIIFLRATSETAGEVRIVFALPFIDFHLKRTIPSFKIIRFGEGRSVSQEPSQPVTELLVKWKHGDAKALNALLPLVYKELKAIARRCLRQERVGHTLQSAALVHEAYLRLANGAPPNAHLSWRKLARTTNPCAPKSTRCSQSSKNPAAFRSILFLAGRSIPLRSNPNPLAPIVCSANSAKAAWARCGWRSSLFRYAGKWR